MTLALDRPTPTPAPALPALAGSGVRVPLVTGVFVDYANLDLAASAPALQAVADHVAQALPLLSSVHRGAGYLSQVSTALLERARDCVGEFVGARPAAAPDGDVVVLTRNTTDALNLLARAVPGPVLCLDVEHHANLLPWRDGPHRTLTAAPTVEETLHDLARALDAAPTALLTVTGASNVTGEVLPLRRIAALAHAAGARVAVDAAQLAPHRRVDLAATGVDYLALSGHKLYAPYGAGALVGRRDWLDAAPPYLAGGGAVTQVDLDAAQCARAAPPRGRHTERPRCRRPGPGVSHARAGAGPDRACARARPARPAHGRSRHRARGDPAADLARQRGPGGGAGLHGRRVAGRAGGGVPLGRARHRGARRAVLRAPAAHPALRRRLGRPGRSRHPGQHSRAREHRPRDHRRARGPAGRRAAPPGLPRPGLDLRAGRGALAADPGPARPRPARCRNAGNGGLRLRAGQSITRSARPGQSFCPIPLV